MGRPASIPKAVQRSVAITPTKSVFSIIVDDKVRVDVTFLDPITPKDLKRQSLVFSYLDVNVTSWDGKDHEVQIYTDITAVEWKYGSTLDGVNYHLVSKQTQQKFTENKDRAEWGNIYYATEQVDGLTYMSGWDRNVRDEFNKTGKLHSFFRKNTQDNNFRSINDKWPVFGYAVDLGSVSTSKPKSAVFSIGLCQEDAVQFLGKDGLKAVPSLWKDEYNDELAALSFFHKDYKEASKAADQLDEKIREDSRDAGGDDYLALTTLATRQAFGATQLVGTKDKHYLFMKEISSNGNTQTVDVIYPSSPIFYYTNPELVKLLLDPHFENQENGHYPNQYAVHDLGSNYPNATGHPEGRERAMPIEECGNHLIMMLAYAQRSGDTEYVKAHYKTLKQWANYLVGATLLPAEQQSTDDFNGRLANQTNLALKGMIGLEAMAQMSKIVGETGDAKNFTDIAHDYIAKWQDQGINKSANPKHAMLNYNNASSYGLLYNLYADKMLNLSLVPQEVYDMQSEFYPTIKEKYGVPLDTRNRYYTKLDWEVFCAAVASNSTQKMFIDTIADWIGDATHKRPLSDIYQTDSGKQIGAIEYNARPVVGGLFALLLMDNGNYKAPAIMM
ncbi:DUF1793-domain-containing protein [Phaeosphaeriaceae sp. SRC1lsM3a]|nr:DUF1793-domain-containing protein [Stagonospora sp. SRC1lsM3a]